MELIHHYFPDLTDAQVEQLGALKGLYKDWNEKINVISRKDIDHLYEHHVLHSLAIAKYNPFRNGMNVLDAGTGGGFPGIPLAIVYPEVQFTLLDSIAKKIRIVNEVIQALALNNATGIHSRLEDHQGEYDLITCRAVSTLTQLVAWSKHLGIKRWIVLKGGDPKEIRKELTPMYKMKFVPVSDYFNEVYFQGKYIVDVIRDP
ncbi:MAG TPA: 16S rRNA (guanine(527)-N(7))-methyltransferase RsmG [Saprospiraceae bacterium]|nr:16S rRNA (guanine(527)-N(7))-methyltransferase RsmG [Saprospiraceae bacterium]